MQADYPSRRLSRLRTNIASSLRSFLRHTAFPVAVRQETTEHDGRTFLGRSTKPEAPLMNARRTGKTILLDDERAFRALAKEIKRLITEEKRRGLGV